MDDERPRVWLHHPDRLTAERVDRALRRRCRVLRLASLERPLAVEAGDRVIVAGDLDGAGRDHPALRALPADCLVIGVTPSEEVSGSGFDGCVAANLNDRAFALALEGALGLRPRETSAVVRIDGTLRGLLPAFLARRRTELSDLRRLAAAGEWLAVQRIGHRLADTCGGYGFDAKGDLGAAVEAAAAAGDPVAVSAALEALERHLGDLRVAYDDEAPLGLDELLMG